jgi:hypothetical protein
LKLLIDACIDIAPNAVRKYPYGLHDRFDSEGKGCFLTFSRHSLTLKDLWREQRKNVTCRYTEFVIDKAREKTAEGGEIMVVYEV